MPPKRKKLGNEKKVAIKENVKKRVKPTVVVTMTRAKRLKKQNSMDAFGEVTILEEAAYVLFPQPVGASTAGARGCKSARVVLGPLVGWPEPQPGTDAMAIYPDAITDVRKDLDDSKYHWKSGHVINADFGGSGIGNTNMTCLTSSANTSQTAFDNNVKKARSALHKVYSTIREAGGQQEFFATLGYGIEINISLSDDAWGDGYPANCISNQMDLSAAIVGEPSEGTVRTAMGDATNMTVQTALTAIAQVRDLIAAANQRSVVYNVK